MIIGFDHLAMNTNNSLSTIADLESRGYQKSFVEFEIDNPIEKSIHLTHYQPKHDLGQFKHPHTHLTIEFTNHGAFADQGTPFELNATTIQIKTNKILEDEQILLQSLKFQKISEREFKLTRPFPQWNCQIELIHEASVKRSMLDSKGYSCLAFICNNIENDLIVAEQNGATSLTSIFALSVNQKKLRIAMFRLPGGALIELIQFDKGNNYV